ncbi:MAG: cytochrome c3 family protein [Nitrospirota bacterium]|nr:cytochrome c3 family protein [Nitrospirota bacterium]
MRDRKKMLLIVLYTLLLLPAFLRVDSVNAGPYLDSAHGDILYGVDRYTTDGVTPFPDYSKGNCAHCHEQHASIEGQTTTPSDYLLFYDNYVSQTDGVCFKCHDNTTTYAASAIVNRSYSFRAGGWTTDTLNDILEAFTDPPSISSHNLGNIQSFIATQSWGFTSNSNPCVACHNPHSAQGDPENSPNTAKTSASRGWPVSRPSLHSTDNLSWGLWGDGTGEKMSDYAGALIYQAPYRYNSTTTFEPDGSNTQNGSNMTDFPTFCLDCHSNSSIDFIDWSASTGDKHGKKAADGTGGSYLDIDTPYTNANGGRYVLSCTDCHEPHGSPNTRMIRREVNGSLLAGTVTTTSGTETGYLCRQCHTDDRDYSSSGSVNSWEYVHHCAPDYPYSQSSCSSCHGAGLAKVVCGGGGGGGGGGQPIDCNNCHFHGSDDSWAPASLRTGRGTF